MSKVNLSGLDLTARRAVFWLAGQAKTVTPLVTNSVSHVGEIWAVAAFMKKHRKGSPAHTAMAERLRLGGKSAETVLDCINRLEPGFLELVENTDEELNALIADLKSTHFSDGR